MRVISTGGTGVTGRDVTPSFSRHFEKEIEGFGEMFRALSWLKSEHLQCSRAVGGVAGGTYLFALPGSPQLVKMAGMIFCNISLISVIAPAISLIMPRLMKGSAVDQVNGSCKTYQGWSA